MRTIHVEGNRCLGCHSAPMEISQIFEAAQLEVNSFMPPHAPGSMADDYQELVDCWLAGPENTPGCDWVVPSARGREGGGRGRRVPAQERLLQPAWGKERRPGQGLTAAPAHRPLVRRFFSRLVGRIALSWAGWGSPSPSATRPPVLLFALVSRVALVGAPGPARRPAAPLRPDPRLALRLRGRSACRTPSRTRRILPDRAVRITMSASRTEGTRLSPSTGSERA